MTCSLCSGVCRCTPDARPAAGTLWQPRFESTFGTNNLPMRAESVHIDPEAAGEQACGSSLERDAWSSRPKFVVEQKVDFVVQAGSQGDNMVAMEEFPPSQQEARPAQVHPNLVPEGDGSSWRREVSERLHRYHARRRPRAPRYPSLRLKFETPEANRAAPSCEAIDSTQAAQSFPIPSPVARQAVAMDYAELTADPDAAFETRVGAGAWQIPEPRLHEATAKIIEFPRSMYAPPIRLDDLAEPIFDRPRILEAPEVVPPPPALGGMTIEEAERAEPERRPGIDMPLQSAPSGQRLLATGIDAALVLVATILFVGVFCRITGATPTVAQIGALAAGLLGAFWASYQYTLVVYSGTTPGLRALRLRVQRFDGNPVGRKLRRARVLCSILSAASLGMGYAWHFLDEDGLCWHERVTKTHIASEKQL